jgi:wyosine [tRNA(Phe)-imidazoG37] synthetase (radical SAM superfamily)
VNRAYQNISQKFSGIEYLIGYEGNAFASSGDISKDLLSITSVHPMREDAVRSLFRKECSELGSYKQAH